jgi:hypothetical protein
MEIYEIILWVLTGWTLIEGSWILVWPKGAILLTRKLFPKWGGFLQEMELNELRKLGTVELIFGLLLGGYLLWAG